MKSSRNHWVGAALAIAVVGAVLPSSAVRSEDDVITSEAATFRVEVIADGLDIPWTMEFLPDGTALVGEREAGRLHRLTIADGTLTPITNLPSMLRDRDISSGLFDVRAHPDFTANGWIYFAYGVGTTEASGLAVDRARIEGARLVDRQRLFETRPRLAGKWHFGGRLALRDGYLFITTGDGYDFKDQAQNLSAHAGKVLRLHDDGRIPDDNPFAGTGDALPEIWSYGVRNPQGMAIHPVTGAPWINEHGPQGGDEINIPRAGHNYGWPVITYGEEYGGGPIGEGITRHEGMKQPVYYWVPSIAPSGMEFYTGDAFPGWQGNLFIGALALTHINRLVVEGQRVMHEERLLDDRDWRVRFIEQGPDGLLYFGTDNGEILRLIPAEEATAPEAPSETG